MAKAASKTSKAKKTTEVKPEEIQPVVTPIEETTATEEEVNPTVEEPQPEITEPTTEPVVEETTVVEEPVAPAMVVEPEVSKEKLYEYAQAAPKQDATMEEKIVAFVDERSGGGYIKLNDFLKSLFPIPKLNEPPASLHQGSSKLLRQTLTNMQAEGKITIKDDGHLRLGTFYYPDEKTMKTHYHNLSTVTIEAMTKK